MQDGRLAFVIEQAEKFLDYARHLPAYERPLAFQRWARSKDFSRRVRREIAWAVEERRKQAA